MTIKPSRIIRSDRKSIALVIGSDAELIVKAPFGAADEKIYSFIEQKQNWIRKKQQFVSENNERNRKKSFVQGEQFPLLGEACPLYFGGSRPQFSEGRLMIPEKTKNIGETVIKLYKAKARQIFEERLLYYSALMKTPYRSLRISGAKKRWGSCGRNNDISLSWRLLMLPTQVIDYLVVHELSHVKHKNHGREYWLEVAKFKPDYKICEQILKRSNSIMDMF